MEERPRKDTRPLGTQRVAQRLSTRRNFRLLMGLSFVLLILAGVGTWYLLRLRPWEQAGGLQVTPPSSLQELATEYPELGNILLDPALDSVYKDFLLAYQQGGEEAALELARQRGVVNDQDEIRMTLELDTTETGALTAELEAMGIRVTAVSGNLIDIAVPLSLIAEAMETDDPGGVFANLSVMDHVMHIRLPVPGMENYGSVDTESIPIIHADAWQEAGFTGKGIKIGVLDLGFDKYTSLLGSDLPETVTARSFATDTAIDGTGVVHGTACAEIIHDIAPDAELFFTIYGTTTEKMLAIDWLVSQGVKIISHSAGNSYGPMDGTGPQARKVDQVTAGGILWVNSAGNEADAHYRATFTDTDGNGYHEFSAGDELLEVHPYGGRITFVLNWDAWKTGDQNLDLYLYDADSKEIASSYNVQSGPGDDAAEIIIFESPGKGPYYIGFYASKVTRPVVLDFFVGGEGGEIEYTTVEHSVLTPADARGAFTVGAVRWDTDVLEGFSSQGPSNDGRLKPEISAPDRVSSAVYGEAFPGTSAAAPHVAGAAALVWQAFPGYSAQQVTEYLKTNAVDLGPSGPDNAYGYGRLYLGDVPGAGFSPEPTTTGVVAPVRTEAPPTSTATGPVAGTQTPAATATVKRMETATPRPQPGGNVSLWPLALLACVVMPGFLGLGGIGLLGGVWYWNRSRRAARPPVAPIAGTQVAPQVPGGQNTPDQQRCPRCGNPHRPQAKFCSYCGLVLRLSESAQSAVVVRAPQYCVRCGQALRPGSKFCPLCGRSR